MSAFVDASVIVRYLVGHPKAMADEAARIVEKVDHAVIAPVSLAEVAYVLQSFYKVPREEIVDQLVLLVQRRNVNVSGLDKGIVLQALMLCRPSARVSFADALLWASARDAATAVYTFDRRFPTEDVEVRQRFRPSA